MKLKPAKLICKYTKVCEIKIRWSQNKYVVESKHRGNYMHKLVYLHLFKIYTEI